MKKSLKVLSLLGAVGALAACNGGEAFRECSFNELARSVYADYANTMETKSFRYNDFHSEYHFKSVVREGEYSDETIVTEICDCSIDQHIFILTGEAVTTETGKEPVTEKYMTAYFYDEEKGGVVEAHQQDDEKSYYIAVTKENMEKQVAEKDSPFKTVDEYLSACFGEVFYSLDNQAITVDGFTQMLMQYTEAMIMTEVQNYKEVTSVKTNGSRYFFDLDVVEEEEDASSEKDKVSTTSQHIELDGMFPISASTLYKDTCKMVDDDDPKILYDAEETEETKVSFKFEFEGSIPDITDFKLVIPE